MPRQREHAMFDEYDARAYSHLIPGQVNSQSGQQFSSSSGRKHEKRKKSKHKSHKRSREKGEKDRSKSRHSQNPPVEVLGRSSIVAYEDVSSESGGSLSDVSGTPSVPSGPSRVDAVRNNRDQSPASAIRSYMNERSHSNSPVIHETSPLRTEKSARKSKKRQRSPDIQKMHEPKLKQYAEPPKAYVEPPRAYADRSSYRNSSPVGKKRHRSRSPTSPYTRRRSRSR